MLVDADQVRLDAVVESTAGFSTAAVCLSIDPRTIIGVATDVRAFDQAQDPTGAFWAATSRMGHIYPQSRCSKGASAQGLAPVHPESGARPGVFVTLGAVGLSSDGKQAHVQVITWPGELLTEVHLLRYRKAGADWQLVHRDLTMQE
jgi:hypothetical protein